MIFRNPETVHNPLASYSHQVEIAGNTRWLVMSAQIGMNKHGEVPEDIFSQIEFALDNIILNLEAAGMQKEDLIKLTFYFVGSHNIEKRRNLINEKLGKHQPCMTVLYVASLATASLKVEIEAWACREK